MIVLSYNIGWLGRDPKRQAIYHLINHKKQDLIMLQERLSSSSKVIYFLTKFLPIWSLCVVYAMGHLSGLIIAWSQIFDVTDSIFSLSGILLGWTLRVIN